ncbi:hypothetical protein DV704_03030 [Meiothermus sp. QL-1]|nr:hypothetical protein DV704_03030 [Meiothermus sp. QL-1]
MRLMSGRKRLPAPRLLPSLAFLLFSGEGNLALEPAPQGLEAHLPPSLEDHFPLAHHGRLNAS